ncbi:MAG TPA: TIR domain-containing protein [Myxococcota bacterium]|nr:TIR domain-containing protein [Myxococcota bacterium]
MRVYVSFDLEHDRDLHDRLLAQWSESQFAIASRSEAGDMNEAWAANVRLRITEADEVVVICGEHTDDSSRVNAELKIAQEERKPYLLLWGRREKMCKKPKTARGVDGMYGWTAAVLERQLADGLRRNRDREARKGIKRSAPRPQAP